MNENDGNEKADICAAASWIFIFAFFWPEIIRKTGTGSGCKFWPIDQRQFGLNLFLCQSVETLFHMKPVCCDTNVGQRRSKVALFNSSKQSFKSDLQKPIYACRQNPDRQSKSLSCQVEKLSEDLRKNNHLISFWGIISVNLILTTDVVMSTEFTPLSLFFTL